MPEELREYRKKRRQGKTPEPGIGEEARQGKAQPRKSRGGRRRKATEPRFVVQWHSARRVHFDVRLELDGVAKSWAVPKGPPLEPGVRRLAVQTEDHPLEYLEWQGDIPAGQYGAGKMRIWDSGTFEVEKRTDRELKVVFHGEKLRGAYVLVKTRGEDWLMLRHRGAAERADGAGAGTPRATRARGESGLGHGGELPVEGPQRLPALRPMLACNRDGGPFDDPDWSFEIKWDGVRTLAFVADGESLLRSRGNHNVTASYPELGSLHRSVRATDAILDGEIVALDERGVSRFQLLQSRLNRRDDSGAGAVPIVFYVFDLLFADGEDLTGLPWRERRERLEDVLVPGGAVRLSEAVEGVGTRLYEAAVGQGAEGIIAKRQDSPYRSGGRSQDWQKVKERHVETFTVGGYTRGEGSRGASFGALLIGEPADGGLRFVGSVGTGFSDAMLRQALERLRPLERRDHPFLERPKPRGRPTWVKPELRCEVEFSERTRDGRLRAPSFRGWAEGEPDRGLDQYPNLDKLYWPDAGVTKGDLLAYYRAVAPHLLPHLEGRPMVLNRFPDGWQGQSFYQKNASEHRPQWAETVRLPADEGRKTIEYYLCPDERHLLWLANLGCIEMNPWLSRLPDLRSPTQVLFDLDPHPPATFADAVEVALILRRALDRLGLQGFPKTSGGKGMHVMVPVQPGLGYDFARMFAEAVARGIEDAHPALATTAHTKERRGPRVLVDFRQNRQGSTIASVYSPRPRAGAPVSTPLRWEEVEPGLDPARFSFEAVLERCREHGDLFEPVLSLKQQMADAVARLPEISYE